MVSDFRWPFMEPSQVAEINCPELGSKLDEGMGQNLRMICRVPPREHQIEYTLPPWNGDGSFQKLFHRTVAALVCKCFHQPWERLALYEATPMSLRLQLVFGE